MFKPAQLILSLIVITALGGASYYVYQQNPDDPNLQKTTEQIQQTADKASDAVDKIDKAVNLSDKVSISADGKSISYNAVEGQTALKTLKSLVEVKTQSSSYGEFVTEINGLKADANKQYWAFYVNGNLASEGAGSYIQQKNDKIEWKLESL